MKVILILFLTVSMVFITRAQSVPVKHALIFAIGNYPDQGGWPTISSLNDPDYIKNILSEQGFAEKNISVLTDKQVTMEGIKNAFAVLTESVNPGDMVVIHFSSHGEQVEADNNNKIDGLDECIVTFNAVSPMRSTNYQRDQAQYLRGHTLGNYLLQLRKKLGARGDVVVFMDNCHSGDGTRGKAKVRGGMPPLESPGYDPRHHFKSDSSLIAREVSAEKVDQKALATYEVFSATRPEELDIEAFNDKTSEYMGSLTLAISRAFENLKSESGRPTYRTLFAKIQSIMNLLVPGQHPLLEGNGSDRLLFGGAFKHQDPYIEITAVDNAANEITLKQGYLAGLCQGARIAVYPSGTIDTLLQKKLGYGTIFEATDFAAKVKMDESISLKKAVDGWCFISTYAYPLEPISINFSPGKTMRTAFSEESISRAKKYLQPLPYIRFSTNPDLIICRGIQTDSLKIYANGYLFDTAKNILSDSAALIARLESYARYRFLVNLHSQVDGLQVEVRLVPIKHGMPDTAGIKDLMLNNDFIAYDGDTLKLWVKNTGTQDAWVNILDLQPDGGINAVLPNTEKKIYPYDLQIAAGSESYICDIQIGPPCGTEIFKIFVCAKEIDVEQIAKQEPGASKRSAMTAIEKIIDSSYPNASKRGSESGNSEATTSEFVFQIKEKKQ